MVSSTATRGRGLDGSGSYYNSETREVYAPANEVEAQPGFIRKRLDFLVRAASCISLAVSMLPGVRRQLFT